VHTLVGAVSLSRPYFYCRHCQQGFSPLEDVLQLSERRTPGELQQAGARLAAEVPFATAQERFTQLTGRSWSDHTIHAVAGALRHAVGVLEVSPPAAAMAQRVGEMAAGQPWRPIMVLASDGAPVPTRAEHAKGPAPGRGRTRANRAGWPGEWQEAKGFRCYLVAHERSVQGLSWYPGQTDEQAAAALRQVRAAGVIPADQVRLGGRGEGANWSGTPVNALCPTAVQLLDDSHGREHGHQVGRLQFGEDAAQAREWVEAMLARLF
jgi:hypothetical protein